MSISAGAGNIQKRNNTVQSILRGLNTPVSLRSIYYEEVSIVFYFVSFEVLRHTNTVPADNAQKSMKHAAGVDVAVLGFSATFSSGTSFGSSSGSSGTIAIISCENTYD